MEIFSPPRVAREASRQGIPVTPKVGPQAETPLQVPTKTDSSDSLFEAVLSSIRARSVFLPDNFKAFLKQFFSEKSGHQKVT